MGKKAPCGLSYEHDRHPYMHREPSSSPDEVNNSIVQICSGSPVDDGKN